MSWRSDHGRRPWQPHLETQADFNPFVSPIAHLDEAGSEFIEVEQVEAEQDQSEPEPSTLPAS
jgi:hypothetical protein